MQILPFDGKKKFAAAFCCHSLAKTTINDVKRLAYEKKNLNSIFKYSSINDLSQQ